VGASSGIVRAEAHGESSAFGPIDSAPADSDAISVGVDEGSGAATIYGSQPKLSLSYSSHRGNGLLGVGWALGLPKIICSHRFGVPDYADCPLFEMGGEVLVGPDQGGHHHTFDESFNRIERFSWANRWEVTTPEGTTSTFGVNSLSRVPGPGGIAEWHLSSTTDAFGNSVYFGYSGGSSSDEGMLYPDRISYADGSREVLFRYEPRPDPSVDYEGGIRRERSLRLKEIQVDVNGQLHHRLVLRYETALSTTQSRLISIQRFGSDCTPSGHPDPVPGPGCSALPAEEFSYTDSREITAGQRWQSTGPPGSAAAQWYAPGFAKFSTGNPFLRGSSTQFADINGDGLPDLVSDLPGRHDGSGVPLAGVRADTVPAPVASPFVYLNDGVGGWEEPTWNGGNSSHPVNPTDVPDNDSALWTDRLRALRFDIASIRVHQVFSHWPEGTDSYALPEYGDMAVLGTCKLGEQTPQVRFIPDGGSVQYAGSANFSNAPHFDATADRSLPTEAYQSPAIPFTTPAESEIRPWPYFQFVDLNADGRADMLMSTHLSGFNLSFEDCASPVPRSLGSDTWIDGATTKVVFLNTGEGWVRDDAGDLQDGNYADSLPILGIVAFESADIAYREIGATQGGGAFADRNGSPSPCDDYGLAGLREERPDRTSTSYDFCVTPYDLAPVFRDLNGDGYPDLIVTKTSDPDSLFHNHYAKRNEGYPVGYRESDWIESVAYLQDPHATDGGPRWIPAPAYDPPYEHALVLQISGESAGVIGPVGFHNSFGNAQTFNVDKGVRFADLNRDGLVDMVFSEGGVPGGYAYPNGLDSPPVVMPRDFDSLGGVLINRGATPAPNAVRHSAWCSSSPVPNIDLCMEEAARYEIPFRFAGWNGSYNSGDLGTRSLLPFQKGLDFVDLNGDGWLDVFRPEYESAGLEPFGDHGALGSSFSSGAYLHQPGIAGSAWVEDAAYRLPETNIFMGWCNCALNDPWVSTGYATADVNGDGVADLIGSDRGYFPQKESWISNPESARSDLLKEYKNGRSLRVELSYASALQQRDSALEARAIDHATAPGLDGPTGNDELAEPPDSDLLSPGGDGVVQWTHEPVLASKRVSRVNAEEMETVYRYAHPRRCLEHKTHLGYRLVERVRGDGSVIETLYYQRHGRAGKLAERTLSDEAGRPLRYRKEIWVLPEPSEVRGGWRAGQAILFDVAYIGRLVSRVVRNEYGDRVGDSTGLESTTSWIYDDTHGYNFVSEEERDVPGRKMRIVKTPQVVDDANYLMQRSRRVQVYANQGSDQRLLSDTRLGYADADNRYTYDKVGFKLELVASRDDPHDTSWRRTYFNYAENGNLIEERKQLPPGSDGDTRSTFYCYDGDQGCPVGQGSRSLVAGIQDAAGMWTYFEPHPTFPGVARASSGYFDVPTLRSEFDPLGRVVEQWYEPSNGTGHVLLSSTDYVDFPGSVPGHGEGVTPFQVERRFAEAEASSSVESIRVSDGANGVALSIELLNTSDDGSNTVAAIARETILDPVSRKMEVTEPFACGSTSASGSEGYGAFISMCAGVSDANKTSTEWTLDPLGRATRLDTPLGVEVFEYSSESLVVIGSGASVPHDAVLHKNAIGGLEEVVLAGGRPVRVRECNNPTLLPGLASLSGVTCANPDETRLAYEPTGELRERIDPTGSGNGGFLGYNVGARRNQRLEYLRDTLGRVIQVDDPDSGVSHLEYDFLGNLVSSTDARGVEIRSRFDVLNRLTRTEVEGESPTVIEYAPTLLGRSKVNDGDLAKWYVYDGLGRVWREGWVVDGISMMIDIRRDYLDRPTRIHYPTILNGSVDAVVYDYDGIHLERVCDAGVRGGDCDSSTATTIISDVDYDALGRVAAIHHPGGVRSFEYDGHSERRTVDAFDSGEAGEDLEFLYQLAGGSAFNPIPGYDGLGNPLRVEATMASQSYEMSYSYDGRNRIRSWNWNPDGSGNATHREFGYDPRGNMILHGGEIQSYTSNTTAHALQTRISGGVTYDYTYDLSGYLRSRSSSTGEMTHYRFDGRGRLVCVGGLAGGCDELAVTYNGEDERVKETGANSFVYAGSNFRLRPQESGGWEYWIEIYALGERVAYKHVMGGAIRFVELFPLWEIPSELKRVLWTAAHVLLFVLGLALVVLIATDSAPPRIALSLGLVVIVSLLPVQARAGSWAWYPQGQGAADYRWVMTDAIGTSRVELDSSGRTLTHSLFEPFGRLAQRMGMLEEGSRSYFAGHDRQLDTDLIFMNARWMEPGSGTFLSVDPVLRNYAAPQSYNGYAYAENNPISGIDPSGTTFVNVYADETVGAVVGRVDVTDTRGIVVANAGSGDGGSGIASGGGSAEAGSGSSIFVTAGGQGLSGVPLVPAVGNVSSSQATRHQLVGLSNGVSKSDVSVSAEEVAVGKDLITLIEATAALARESEAAVNFSNTAGSDDKVGDIGKVVALGLIGKSELRILRNMSAQNRIRAVLNLPGVNRRRVLQLGGFSPTRPVDRMPDLSALRQEVGNVRRRIALR
jgi:RHS repeat-associated protein